MTKLFRLSIFSNTTKDPGVHEPSDHYIIWVIHSSTLKQMTPSDTVSVNRTLDMLLKQKYNKICTKITVSLY